MNVVCVVIERQCCSSRYIKSGFTPSEFCCSPPLSLSLSLSLCFHSLPVSAVSVPYPELEVEALLCLFGGCLTPLYLPLYILL